MPTLFTALKAHADRAKTEIPINMDLAEMHLVPQSTAGVGTTQPAREAPTFPQKDLFSQGRDYLSVIVSRSIYGPIHPVMSSCLARVLLGFQPRMNWNR